MDDFNARDLFAGLAMVGLIMNWDHKVVPEKAYDLAEAMLKEKEKRDERVEG